MTAVRPEGRADSGGEEDKRLLASKLVNALYRVIKACQIHAEHNQAVTQVIEAAVQSTVRFCERAGVRSVAMLFTPHAVFVNRQMLRASKETYQLALELGTLLLACDATEITVSHDVSPGEIAEFGRAAANASRDGRPSVKLKNGGWEGLRLRKVQGLGASANVAPTTKAARTFAAALMILKSFYGDLRAGNYEPRQGVKRISQKLVSASELEARLLLSIAAVPSADPDRSQSLLSTAIVALAMANQLTTDRSLLSSIVTAALLYDVGRPRMLGHDTSSMRTLNADEEALQLTSSVVAITALGKLHPPNLTRAVLVHETHALKAGIAPYRAKRSPLLASRVVALARTFVELRTPSATGSALSLDDAIQVLDGQAPDNTGRTLIKLLVGALGLFPAGTMVELSTGEMGVVLATPAMPVDFARPPVRILYDDRAQLLPEPIDIDLATEPGRSIRKAIDSTDQQMRQMREYVMGVAARRARRHAEEAHESASRDSFPSESSSGASSFASARSQASAQSNFGSSAGPISAPFGAAGATSHGRPSSGQSSGGHSSSGHSSAGYSSGGSSAGHQPLRGSSPGRATGHAPHPGLPKQARRPSTMRWDPRAEEQGPGAPALPAPPVEQQSGQTRSVSWGELNKEIEATLAPEPEADRARLSVDNDTDSILAAYLADDSGRSSSQGESSSRSWGLRWTSSGKSSAFDQTGSSSGTSAVPGGPSSSGGSPLPDSTGGEEAWDEVFAAPPPRAKDPTFPPPPPAPPLAARPVAADGAKPGRPLLRDTPTPPVAMRSVRGPSPNSIPTPSMPQPAVLAASLARPPASVTAQSSSTPPATATGTTARPPSVAAAPVSVPTPPVSVTSGPVSVASPASRAPRAVSASSWAAPAKSRRDVELLNAPEPTPDAGATDDAPVSSGAGPVDSAQRRAKAGSAAWGTPRKESKK